MKNVKWILISSLILTLSGCLPLEEAEGPVTLDVDAIVNDNSLSPSVKAEKLAVIAERLFTPASFMYSADVSALALKFDRSNDRALLFNKMAAPIIVTKGAVARVQPLVAKLSPTARRSYLQLREDISNSHAVYDFYMAKGTPIMYEAQAQRLVDQVLAAQNELRMHIQSIKRTRTLEVTARVPSLTDGIRQLWRTCTVATGEQRNGYHGSYRIDTCPYLVKKVVTLSAGDFEMLQHIVAGVQISTTLGNSYNANGAVQYSQFDRSNSDAGLERHLIYVRNLNSLGALRGQSQIRNIEQLGSDLYAGAQWADQLQFELCPEGWHKTRREGALFQNGICTGDYPGSNVPADRVFRSLQTAVSGGALSVLTSSGRFYVRDLAEKQHVANYETQASFFAPILNPISDLRTLLPTQVNRCGKAANIGDNTVGGLLPNGDGERVAREMNLLKSDCP